MKLLKKIWEFYERFVDFVISLLLGKKATDSLKEKIISFADFCLVGVLNTVVSLSCYYIVLYCNADYYQFGYCIGFVLSVLNAYFWSSNFVFHKTDEKLKTFFKTGISYFVTFILGKELLTFFVEVCGISKILAPILQLIIITPVNYLINKFWSYKK